MFHGAVDEVVPFFGSCGFKSPARKNMPDWLQELTSRREQQVNECTQVVDQVIEYDR